MGRAARGPANGGQRQRGPSGVRAEAAQRDCGEEAGPRMNGRQNLRSAAHVPKGDGAEAADTCAAWLPLATRAPSEKTGNSQPHEPAVPATLFRPGTPRHALRLTPRPLQAARPRWWRRGSHTARRNCARCVLGAWACCSGTAVRHLQRSPGGCARGWRRWRVASLQGVQLQAWPLSYCSWAPGAVAAGGLLRASLGACLWSLCFLAPGKDMDKEQHQALDARGL